MTRRCVALVFFVTLALGLHAPAGAQSATLDQAMAALTRLYNGGIYNRAECRRTEYKGHIFVLCSSTPRDSQSPGGLFAIHGSGGDVSISPLNGRAMGHVAQMRSLPAGNGVAVAVAPVDRSLANLITPVLDQFF